MYDVQGRFWFFHNSILIFVNLVDSVLFSSYFHSMLKTSHQLFKYPPELFSRKKTKLRAFA